MTSDNAEQTLSQALSQGAQTYRRFTTMRGDVATLAGEALQRVARRAVELREARDHAAVKEAALILAEGTEETAFATLDRLDDPNRTLDWFLAERLGPIAREIGALWNNGDISVRQATNAASRIYSFLRYRHQPGAIPDHGLKKSATFALVPGDMHTVAIAAAADVFRARGWDVTLLIGYSGEELAAHFRNSNDRIFGFAAGSPESLEQLGRVVVALSDLRPEASVLVAGHVADDPSTLLVLPGEEFRDAELEATCNWFEAHTPAHGD